MAVINLAGVNQPGDIVLPMARILHVPDRGTTLKDIGELPYRLGGMAVKPTRALAWKANNGDTTLLPGLGVTEAAELQDYAYALHDRQQKLLVETQDQRRERLGLPPVQTFLNNLSDAMQDKADWFRRNPFDHQANYDPDQKAIY